LPSEQYIRDVVTGEARGSGQHAMTEKEVIEKLLKAWKGKVGVREKVQEVIKRKCTVKDGYLSWTY
jgi:3-hydroxyisobutyryl-CoA hydrolase